MGADASSDAEQPLWGLRSSFVRWCTGYPLRQFVAVATAALATAHCLADRQSEPHSFAGYFVIHKESPEGNEVRIHLDMLVTLAVRAGLHPRVALEAA